MRDMFIGMNTQPHPSTTPASLLIDAAELARMLSVSKPTIWRMLSAQRAPEPLRLTAQCLRWRRSDVEAWLAAGCPAQQRPTGTNGEASKIHHATIANEVPIGGLA